MEGEVLMDYSAFYKQIMDILVSGILDAMEPIYEVIQKTLVIVLPVVGIISAIEIGIKMFKYFACGGEGETEEIEDTFMYHTWSYDRGSGLYTTEWHEAGIIDNYDWDYEDAFEI